jgi:hypothetical protein
LVVSLVLGAGLAVIATLFTIEDAVLFRPLPVPNASKLFAIEWSAGRLGAETVAVDARTVADLNVSGPSLFSRYAGVARRVCAIHISGAAATVPCAMVTASFFPTLGLSNYMSQGANGLDEAVIGYDFWRTRLGGIGSVTGATLVLQDFNVHTLASIERRLRIVGVAPRGFYVPGDAEIWYQPLPTGGMRIKSMALWALGRPGVQTAHVAAALSILQTRLGSGPRDAPRLATRPLRDALTPRDANVVLVILLSVVALVVVGWVHTVSLSGTRLLSDRRALAARLSIGATVTDIVWENAGVGLLISVTSLCVSQPVAAWATRSLVAVLPMAQERHVAYGSVGVAVSVAAASAFFVIYVVMARWIIPRACALHQSLLNPQPSSGDVFSRLLAGGSLALMISFIYCATVLGVTYYRTYNQAYGFKTEHLVSVQLTLPLASIGPRLRESPDTWPTKRLVQQVRALPDTLAAAHVLGAPFGLFRTRREVSTDEDDAYGAKRTVVAGTHFVGAEYFQTLGVAMLSGRDFNQEDEADDAAVINRSLAARLWPDGWVAHRYVRVGKERLLVVGICADFSDERNAAAVGPHLFLAEKPGLASEVVVRSRGSGIALLERILELAKRMEPTAEVSGFSYDRLRSQQAAPERGYAQFMLFVAGAAIAMAVFGMYAVVAESVHGHAKSAAVRLAVGAPRGKVMLHLLSQVVRLIVVGTAAGAVLAALAVITVSNTLRLARAVEPGAIAVCCGVTTLALAGALLPPLRWVCRFDVVAILRSE